MRWLATFIIKEIASAIYEAASTRLDKYREARRRANRTAAETQAEHAVEDAIWDSERKKKPN